MPYPPGVEFRDVVAYTVFRAVWTRTNTPEIFVSVDQDHPDVKSPLPIVGLKLNRLGPLRYDVNGITIAIGGDSGPVAFVPWSAVQSIRSGGYTIDVGPSHASLLAPEYLLASPLIGVPGGNT